MSRRWRLVVVWVLLGIGLVGGYCAVRALAAPSVLEEADRFYEQRSYAEALPRYQRAVQEGLAGGREAEIEYRIAMSLARCQRWDDAIAAAREFVKRHADGLWGARGQYWLGELLTVVPHEGWQIGERVWRGADYPKVETAEKPEQVWLYEEDRKGAIAAFERAKTLFEGLRPTSEPEEADLSFDLARLLSSEDLVRLANALAAVAKEKQASLQLRFREPDIELVKRLRGHAWMVAPAKPYEAGQPFPQRILTLFAQIERLDSGRRTPQARLARALYLTGYQQQMRELMRVYDSKKQQWVELPFPYQEVDALALLRTIPEEFPKHDLAPQVQLLVGEWLEGKGDYVAALAAYRELAKRWPASKWLSDARARIQDIEWPTLQLAAQPSRPGQKAVLTLTGRNVKSVHLTAYRVRLEELLLRKGLLDNSRRSWQSWADALGDLDRPQWRTGKRVAQWGYVTGDAGEHKWLNERVAAPLTEVGAYVVEASSRECRAATLVLISDLAVVQKVDKERALAFVCDARTGAPVSGAEVVMREVYLLAGVNEGQRLKVDVARGQSDGDGLKGKRMVVLQGAQENRVETLAWVGERYAVTFPLHRYGYWREPRTNYRVYAYTERPVYRPGQRVYFRAVVTAREAGEQEEVGRYRPVTGLAMTVSAHDPRGEKVYQGSLTTNEFGSLDGSFEVGPEAALGEYSIRVSPDPTGGPWAGGARFRVEEYKKPEFEVTVAPAAEQARVGEAVKATLRARYYFGSPVVGAEVKYRIYRRPHYPYFRFPDRHDWLISSWTGESRRYGGWRGEVIREGQGRTDAAGELALDIDTSMGGTAPEARAYAYTVEAEVTDESRRTITGSGEVKASKQQFFAFLDVKRGFYQVGDRVEVEVATRDVTDRPVAAKGEMRVEKVVRGQAALVEEVVHAEPIATDQEGRAFFHWTPEEGGQYRFTFAARDAWKEEVSGSAYTWVHGPGFDEAAFRLSGITLVPENRTYEEGETCRLLIVSSLPNATVLLAQEAGRQILARSVLPINGKSRVVEVVMAPQHLPNFRFHATTVKEWQAYEAETEIFVPPAKQFLNISVSSDKAHYRPGEKATFTLKATDWQGRPMRAELSLGVVDAALFYIQQEYTPDPRLFFYGQRRGTEIGLTWSFQWTPGAVSRTDRKRQSYRPHEWTLPEDMGRLQDWPPDLVGDWPLRSVYYEMADRRAVPAGPAGPQAMDAVSLGRGRMAGGFGLGGVGGGRGGARAEGGVMLRPAPPMAGSKEAAFAFEPAPAEAELAAAQVRTQFADTAYWSPAVVTDEKGLATATVTMPENLTTWRATVRGFTTEVRVGEAKADAVTRKDLILRLQAPRFFRERDLVALSANVHNYLETDKRIQVSLSLDAGALELQRQAPSDLGLARVATEPSVWITVPRDGEQRVDWVVRVLRPGTATVRMTAQTDRESDAMEMQFPALVHGAEKVEAHSGVLRLSEGSETATVKLAVPKERRRGATVLNVQLMPSLAAVALESLPYLAEYPYGCIEQTMSRFLPAVVTARTLSELGVDLDVLRKRAEAYAKEREAGGERHADSGYTYPKGMPGSFDAADMTRGRKHPPVFSREELDRMVSVGLQRVYNKQNEDGGWGWWPTDTSDPYMSAYVVYGLFAAREAGYDIKDDALERGFRFLLGHLKEDDNLHRVAYLASVATLRGSVGDDVKQVISDRLYRNRMRLTPYSQALLAVALKQIGETDQARVLLGNLRNTANVDKENGTANWRPRQRGWWWWHWWDNPVETNAAVLRALVAIRPDDELTPMVVKWMVNNRRGNHWGSTKETALAVYALADYMRVKKELAPDYTITVDLDGKVRRTYRVNAENALFFDNRFLVGDEVIGDGEQTLTIRVEGRGTLYYTAYLQYFSLEEDVKGGGNEIFVQRRYFRLTPKLVERKQGKSTWQELTWERAELTSGARLQSGDLIEVELVIDAKNNYEYLVFEDMKPAGCEPVEVRSGYDAGEGAGAAPYVELRDEKVAVFISNMPQGTRAVRYRLRAEIPGEFHAMPTNGYSMYAPDVRCLSDEWRVTISD